MNNCTEISKESQLTQDEIEQFDLIPYGENLCIKEFEIARYGSLFVPNGSKELQTNEGTVIAVGSDVSLCQVGDIVFYGQYSGAWIQRQNKKYRVLSQEDLFGLVKSNTANGACKEKE